MASTFEIDPSTLKSVVNKTVLITGGSSGIGLATAQLIASLSSSNNIAILDRNPPPPNSLAAVPPSRFFFHKCDITSWADQRAGFEGAAQKFGAIDAVFANAGITEYGDQFFTDSLDADGKLAEPDRRVLDIDMNAASDTVKLGIHWLRKNKSGGSIILTASLAGYLASAGLPLYSAAKHGVVGLMRALKRETAKFSISISVVAPAITTTPILVQEVVNEGKLISDPVLWSSKMAKLGVPINKAESIALAVAHLINQGLQSNGNGILVQGNKFMDFENGIATSREQWMGKEMLDLFRSGRDAPLFQTIKGNL